MNIMNEYNDAIDFCSTSIFFFRFYLMMIIH